MSLQSNPTYKTKFSLVSAQNMTTKVYPEKPDRLGSRVLELMGHLQTTLNIQQLIKIFYEETKKHATFDGLSYHNTNETESYLHGKKEPHSTSYSLDINSENLGKITFYRAKAFSESELEALENMLCGLIYPLRNTQMYHQAIDASTTDPLTNICNRSAYDETIKREFILAKRNASVLSLLVIDIDFFKTINDKFGHTMGDTVLKQVAHIIQQTIRASDMVFRYGGEEFVALLSNTSVEGAKLLAERIRQNISATKSIGGINISLTVSIGVSQIASTDATAQDLFIRADTALYKAKNSGRDQVSVG